MATIFVRGDSRRAYSDLVELAEVVDRDHLDRRAGLLGDQLPRHDVRVMLEPRQHDLVAGLQHRSAVALRDQVDAVGRALGQDDRVRVGGIEERRRLLARAFVEPGRALAQQMRRAMDVRVRVAVVVVGRLDHRQRLLARVRAIQIDERLAVHQLRQDRKVGADLRDVEASRPSAFGSRPWLLGVIRSPQRQRRERREEVRPRSARAAPGS